LQKKTQKTTPNYSAGEQGVRHAGNIFDSGRGRVVKEDLKENLKEAMFDVEHASGTHATGYSTIPAEVENRDRFIFAAFLMAWS
jgi:hypothetical protein